MDAETKAYVHHAEAIDGVFADIAGVLSNDDEEARAAAGTLAKIGLESADRLTVTRTQAQLLLYVCDLLNREDDA